MESLVPFTGALTCHFEHAFSVECPTLLLGRDLLGSLKVILQLGGPEQSSPLS